MQLASGGGDDLRLEGLLRSDRHDLLAGAQNRRHLEAARLAKAGFDPGGAASLSPFAPKTTLPIDPSVRALLEAVITGFSVVGGAMACVSGFYADRALAEQQPAEVVARRVNEGIGHGFRLSWQLSIGVLIIMAWT